MMSSMALVLAMGCGKGETTKPQRQAKAPAKPALPDSKKDQPKPILKKKTPPPKVGPTVEAKKPGTILWEFVTGDEVDSYPAIGADGTVYVGSFDGKVYALDGKTGAIKWKFETGDGVNSSPAIGADGTIYVGSWDNKVYALDGRTGAKKWEFLTGDEVHSSPAIGADGTVYIGSNDGKVYAIASSSKGLAKSPWPMFGQNVRHTGRAPAK